MSRRVRVEDPSCPPCPRSDWATDPLRRSQSRMSARCAKQTAASECGAVGGGSETSATGPDRNSNAAATAKCDTSYSRRNPSVEPEAKSPLSAGYHCSAVTWDRVARSETSHGSGPPTSTMWSML
jgi:hypothetical protein